MAQAYPFQTPPIIVFSSCKLLNLNSNEQWCLVSDSIQLRGRTQKRKIPHERVWRATEDTLPQVVKLSLTSFQY